MCPPFHVIIPALHVIISASSHDLSRHHSRQNNVTVPAPSRDHSRQNNVKMADVWKKRRIRKGLSEAEWRQSSEPSTLIEEEELIENPLSLSLCGHGGILKVELYSAGYPYPVSPHGRRI